MTAAVNATDAVVGGGGFCAAVLAELRRAAVSA